ncbi:hypothetical protein BH23VER1_BH23VER1_31070 [soil metagenome]
MGFAWAHTLKLMKASLQIGTLALAFVVVVVVDAVGGVANTTGEWRLDNSLNEQANIADMLTAAGFSPAFASATIADQPATVLEIPALGSGQWLALPHRSGSNGEFDSETVPAGRTNEWTLVLDVLFRGAPDAGQNGAVLVPAPLLQTDLSNEDAAAIGLVPSAADDGQAGGIQIGGTLVTAPDALIPDHWYRLAFTSERVSATELQVTAFVDGIQGGAAVSAFAGVLSLDPQRALLFADGSGSGAGIDLNTVGFWPEALPAGDVAKFGAVSAGGIFADSFVGSSAASGAMTLSAAVDAAEGPTRIRFGQEVGGTTIVLESELSPGTKDIIFDGSDPGSAVTVSGGGGTRILVVGAGGSASLIDLVLEDGLGDCTDRSNPEPGGAVFNGGDLSVFGRTLFRHNHSCFGGALFNDGHAFMRMSASGRPTFLGNSASYSGGAIYNNDLAALALDGTSFGAGSLGEGNTAFWGGAIYNDCAVLEVARSVFRSNSANDGGGAIDNRGGLGLLRCDFEGNFAGLGGALAHRAPQGTSNNSVPPDLFAEATSFIDNFADNGGAIFNDTATTLIAGTPTSQVVNSTIDSNTALSAGGGIFNHSSSLVIESSTVTRNLAANGQGPGIASVANSAVAQTVLTNTVVAENNVFGTSDTVRSDLDLVGDSAAESSFFSNGGNLVGTGTGAGAFVSAGDQAGVMSPLLGPLQTVVGTQSRAPLSGSPAIDAGVFPSGLVALTDQRGNQRVLGSAIDVGSVESGFGGGPALGFIGIAPAGVDPDTGMRLFAVGWPTVDGTIYELECSQSLGFENPLTMGPMTGDGTPYSVTVPLRPGSEFVRVRTLQR